MEGGRHVEDARSVQPKKEAGQARAEDGRPDPRDSRHELLYGYLYVRVRVLTCNLPLLRGAGQRDDNMAQCTVQLAGAASQRSSWASVSRVASRALINNNYYVKYAGSKFIIDNKQHKPPIHAPT